MKRYEEYLHMLVNEIHSTIFATVDNNGNPVTCAIDIMLAGEEGLYFLTARGKAFYDRLVSHPIISLTGIKGKNTLSSKSITICGKVKEIGNGRIPEIFAKNQYMAEIYPDEKSRTSLTVFQIYEGEGEFFDLSVKPIFREKFSFGNAIIRETGYFVTEKCDGCSLCYDVCPQKCIDVSYTSVKIKEENCLHCGRCTEACDRQAIERR
ncbi:(4Fe-4S)-binding protein [Candidatus Methanomassiliicoccus intestinalis]|uniref:Indolepyruvate ferredoxin oxidoreductase, alpha and beta subunits n=1 Tax=Methanomassiliicoccus intestinalis (strain Issoire-Mx1) TaxID=1295009 RepID=R9T7D4_METII|nr:4Fe-4S binding protein [Candidatus Methanomassiliicoccus intestinalis]AGN26615.1 Indolepyruvate ferredoxin oxidoreductase, alpha and beta subunits [Candidatus Methanomassiliicoccus intestinalis Issoire-Mx1]TQS83581.1 MAG: (4Fe-4S)-binding protein [Candidatus Methanomassiliicoccus intestinalis]